MKKGIFYFILGMLFCGGIVYAANFYAKDIVFESNDENWEVNNVQDALNDLYENSNTSKSIEFYLGEGTNIGGASGYRGSLRFDTKWFQENVKSVWVRNCASSSVNVEMYYSAGTSPYNSNVVGTPVKNTSSEYKEIIIKDVDSDTYKYTWIIASSGANEYMTAAEIKLELK